jgi:hypothetical protein
MNRTSLIPLIIIGLVSPLASAADLFVPRQYPAIQAAIDAAATGDTILVAPGVYSEAISVVGKSLALIGVEGPEVTIIDAGAMNKPVVNLASAGGALQGFTLRHSRGGSIARGMRIFNSFLQISSCVITGNHPGGGGGGAWQTGSTVTWTDCAFIGNTAKTIGGGLLTDGFGSTTLAQCTFAQNESLPTGDFSTGGGAVVRNAAFHECAFLGNTAAATDAGFNGGGGAVQVTLAATFTDCTFTGNVGGAIRWTGGAGLPPITIDRCTFTNNSGIWGGGALQLHNAAAVVIDSQFQFNSADNEGGAINANADSHLTLQKCLFKANQARQAGAVAVFGEADIDSCAFESNVAEQVIGAVGFYSFDGILSGSVKNCVIAGNIAGGICGGLAVLVQGVTVQNTTVCDNIPDNVLGIEIDPAGNEFCEAPLIADLNGDATVDGADLGIILGLWGEMTPIGDLDNDGVITNLDRYYLIQSWSK